MLLITFILIFLMPFLEIFLIIEIGQYFGAMNTIIMILATAILGAVLVRIEGLSTLSRIKSSVQSGELPTIELISGGILIISAVVLLMPGFITDVLGLVLMSPSLRRRVASIIALKFFVRQETNSGADSGKVIDTEFKVED